MRDDLRGGDIDLHVIAATAAEATMQVESAFRRDLEDRIGEQHVDLLLLAPDDDLRPIDHIAVNEGVLL